MTTEKKGWFYYGWVVVGIAFLIMAFDYLIRYSYPVFFEALQEEFGWSRTQITFAFTMQMMF